MSFFRAVLATLNGVFSLIAANNQNYGLAFGHIVIMLFLCAFIKRD